MAARSSDPRAEAARHTNSRAQASSNADGPAAYLPVGRVIERTMAFVPEGGGHAIVLITRRSPARNARACATMAQSMHMRIGPASGRPTRVDGTLVFRRPVYWPVTVRTSLNCSSLLQNYDFERAMINLQRIPRWTRLGQGPFVVVKKENGNQAGLFDFSNVAAEDFGDQFAAVVNYMSQRPDVWSPAFYRHASFRQTMRLYVLERSGDAPLVLASLVDLSQG